MYLLTYLLNILMNLCWIFSEVVCLSCSVPPKQLCSIQAWPMFYTVFTTRAYARAVLGVVILSVHLSVCLYVCLYVCPSVDKTKWRTADIFIPHERAITLLLWYQVWLVGDAPSLWNLRSKWPTPFEKRWLPPISAHNVSTVGDSEKSSITTNIKSTTGLSLIHIWRCRRIERCRSRWSPYH